MILTNVPSIEVRVFQKMPSHPQFDPQIYKVFPHFRIDY